jgi:hypothetical protein
MTARPLGRTITEASRECAEAARQAELVVLLDDAITGTRFIKLFDALIDQIGRDRFLPIVMRFRDPSRSEIAESSVWERLVKRVQDQAGRLSYPSPIAEFPSQQIFKVDAGAPVRWESPIIWGDSDLIAGKQTFGSISPNGSPQR